MQEERKIVTLKDLEIGDKFYPASQIGKRTPYFLVCGLPEFNKGHGSATRKCKDLSKDILVDKSCRLKVIKQLIK